MTSLVHNGLLPDGTKPLHEPMLINPKNVLWHSLESDLKKVLIHLIRNMWSGVALKITTKSPRGQCVNSVHEFFVCEITEWYIDKDK